MRAIGAPADVVALLVAQGVITTCGEPEALAVDRR
jgi:hypothetical protein